MENLGISYATVYHHNMTLGLSTLWHGIQRQLLPVLSEELGPLCDNDRRFVEVLALVPTETFLWRFEWSGNGRPPCSRLWLFHAFLAKSVYGFPTTVALIEALRTRPSLRRLCGWETAGDVPDAATFSRAFADFAEVKLVQQLHADMVQTHCGPKLVGHISRDATAIAARERPVAASPPGSPVPDQLRRKRGRPKKGQEPPPPPPTRLQQQPQRTLEENLADLPCQCDSGCKRGSKGQPEYWRGYKIHLDTVDGDVPVAAILTSASTHDSQVAIPLMQMTSQRVTALYELMDAAYDAQAIHDFAASLGHVPLIEPVQRGNWVPLDPAQRKRFGERSASERVNSRLKEEFGGRTVRVRGAAKVMTHLMFGVLAITALALWQRLC